MKVKKKAKWIRKAMKEFQDYEEQVIEFKSKHPEFNPPSVKSFLTQEEQKILGIYNINHKKQRFEYLHLDETPVSDNS